MYSSGIIEFCMILKLVWLHLFVKTRLTQGVSCRLSVVGPWRSCRATHGLPCRAPVYRGCPCRDPPVSQSAGWLCGKAPTPLGVVVGVVGLCVRVPRSCATENTYKFWLLDGPSLLLFTFGCIWHVFPHFWPHIVGSWCRVFPRQYPSRPCYPSIGFSFNTMNLVEPVHASDNCLLPSTFQ